MFIATVQSNDRSKPHRGGMDCPTQPRAAPTGLGNILMDIVGYRHVTPTGFGISRRVRFRPTTKLRHSQPLTSDLPTEAFNGCCLERLVSPLVSHTQSGLNSTLTTLPLESEMMPQSELNAPSLEWRKTKESRMAIWPDDEVSVEYCEALPAMFSVPGALEGLLPGSAGHPVSSM